MSVTIVFAGLLLAQAGSASLTDTTPYEAVEQHDVAYGAIASGALETAVAQLQAQLANNPQDPALLINLGTAYAALGQTALAREAYGRAITSRDRYHLELANGEWIDSRRAARDALAALDRNTAPN